MPFSHRHLPVAALGPTCMILIALAGLACNDGESVEQLSIRTQETACAQRVTDLRAPVESVNRTDFAYYYPTQKEHISMLSATFAAAERAHIACRALPEMDGLPPPKVITFGCQETLEAFAVFDPHSRPWDTTKVSQGLKQRFGPIESFLRNCDLQFQP